MKQLRKIAAACALTYLTAMIALAAPAFAAEEKPQTLFINVNIFDGTSGKLAINRRRMFSVTRPIEVVLLDDWVRHFPDAR